MSNIRIIARLDIKGPNLIKGVQLEGLRVIGNPNNFATKYYEDGIDEIIYMDAVASLYGRNSLSSLLEKTIDNVFVPITVGGGIRNLDDVRKLLRSGADKVAINTGAVKNPNLIKDIINEIGSQSLVLSVEAKKVKEDQWNVFIDGGREPTNIDIFRWIEKSIDFGIGEIFLTSIDRDGTRKGFDLELINKVSTKFDVPIIASGGMGKLEHFKEVCEIGLADAVAIGTLLHYADMSISQIKAFAKTNNINIRA